MRAIIIACLLLTGALGASAAERLSGEEEIQALIEIVENSKDMIFIRNGDEHTAAKAADHLRMKLKGARRWIDVETAETFIKRVASESSISGRDYYVREKGKKQEPARKWFERQLERLRKDPSYRGKVQEESPSEAKPEKEAEQP